MMKSKFKPVETLTDEELARARETLADVERDPVLQVLPDEFEKIVAFNQLIQQEAELRGSKKSHELRLWLEENRPITPEWVAHYREQYHQLKAYGVPLENLNPLEESFLKLLLLELKYKQKPEYLDYIRQLIDWIEISPLPAQESTKKICQESRAWMEELEHHNKKQEAHQYLETLSKGLNGESYQTPKDTREMTRELLRDELSKLPPPVIPPVVVDLKPVLEKLETVNADFGVKIDQFQQAITAEVGNRAITITQTIVEKTDLLQTTGQAIEHYEDLKKAIEDLQPLNLSRYLGIAGALILAAIVLGFFLRGCNFGISPGGTETPTAVITETPFSVTTTPVPEETPFSPSPEPTLEPTPILTPTLIINFELAIKTNLEPVFVFAVTELEDSLASIKIVAGEVPPSGFSLYLNSSKVPVELIKIDETTWNINIVPNTLIKNINPDFYGTHKLTLFYMDGLEPVFVPIGDLTLLPSYNTKIHFQAWKKIYTVENNVCGIETDEVSKAPADLEQPYDVEILGNISIADPVTPGNLESAILTYIIFPAQAEGEEPRKELRCIPLESIIPEEITVLYPPSAITINFQDHPDWIPTPTP